MEPWKHLRAILLLPFVVTVVVPATILLITGPDTFDLWPSFPATRVSLPILGGALLCLGPRADGRHDPAVRDGR